MCPCPDTVVRREIFLVELDEMYEKMFHNFQLFTILQSVSIFYKNTMIAYISGKILEISETAVTLLPESGVGYEVGINELTFSKLVLREEASLYIYHHITENNQSLFGFETLEEKKLFTELLKISGIGGKVGLHILML